MLTLDADVIDSAQDLNSQDPASQSVEMQESQLQDSQAEIDAGPSIQPATGAASGELPWQ